MLDGVLGWRTRQHVSAEGNRGLHDYLLGARVTRVEAEVQIGMGIRAARHDGQERKANSKHCHADERGQQPIPGWSLNHEDPLPSRSDASPGSPPAAATRKTNVTAMKYIDHTSSSTAATGQPFMAGHNLWMKP